MFLTYNKVNNMNTVMMLAICWIVQNGELREAWRSESEMTAEHCLKMTEVFAQGGKKAAITVKCSTVK